MSLPERAEAGVLRGDIDGDGHRDRASIRYALRARTSCGFLLVVETRRRTLAVRVPELAKQDMPVSEWTEVEPFIAVIARLAPGRSQIVVARERSASVVNVSLYGIVHGRLKLLRFPSFPRDRLSLFGSIASGYTEARCRRGGPLITLDHGFPAKDVVRTDYALADDRFVVTSRRIVVSTPYATPFTGCAIARGRTR